MTLKTEIANELVWAIEATAEPPYLAGGISAVQKLRIIREYARLHRLLRDLDNQIREWEPVSMTSKS